jgi:3-dehydroquinate synthase
MLVQRITVPFEYPVRFERGMFATDRAGLVEVLRHRETGRRHRAFVVIDRGVADAWPRLAADIRAYAQTHSESLELVAEPEVVEGGEAIKNDPRHVSKLQARLDACGMDRQAVVIAIGGGAVLDMVGYAAATAHRGIRLIRVPTTVLSQADSAVGVKNGVNAFGKKNFLGTFAPPFAVIIDTDFITTLSPRDQRAGMAEAVKVALVRDAPFFEWLWEHAPALARFDRHAVDELIDRCARIHLNHIATSGDPFEFGSARPLDFGHWIAHKLEALTSYELRHGEAVAIGMALDTLYSASVGMCTRADSDRVIALLTRLGFRLWDAKLDERDDRGALRALEGLTEFREHLGGELCITLLESIGVGREVHEMDEACILSCLAQLRVGYA